MQPLARVAVARRVVGLEAGARVLGLVHGDVGALQQRVGVGAVVGAQRGADAGVHHDLEPFDLERCWSATPIRRADVRRPREPGARQQQRELVAAEARDQPGARRPPPAGAAPSWASSRSPAWWPSVSLRSLKRSRSTIATASRPRRRRQLRAPAARGTARRFASPVSSSVSASARECVQRGVLDEGQRHPDRARARASRPTSRRRRRWSWSKWSSDEQAAGDEREQRRRDERAPALERDLPRRRRRAPRGDGDQQRREQARAPAPTAGAAHPRSPADDVADVGDDVRDQAGAEQQPDRAHAPAAQRHGDERPSPRAARRTSGRRARRRSPSRRRWRARPSSPSSWVTIAAAPTAPIAASSHSAGADARAAARGRTAAPRRRPAGRRRAGPRRRGWGSASRRRGRRARSRRSPRRAARRRARARRRGPPAAARARSSTATVAARTGRPAARTRITPPAIGARRAELDDLDECWLRARAGAAQKRRTLTRTVWPRAQATIA